MLVLHLNGLSQSGTIVTYRHRGKLTDRLTNHIVNEGSLVCYLVLYCVTLNCVLQYCTALHGTVLYCNFPPPFQLSSLMKSLLCTPRPVEMYP